MNCRAEREKPTEDNTNPCPFTVLNYYGRRRRAEGELWAVFSTILCTTNLFLL